MGTIIFILAIICSASWTFTATLFKWMEKRENQSETKIKIQYHEKSD
jgi:hypothetical protein